MGGGGGVLDVQVLNALCLLAHVPLRIIVLLMCMLALLVELVTRCLLGWGLVAQTSWPACNVLGNVVYLDGQRSVPILLESLTWAACCCAVAIGSSASAGAANVVVGF